MKTSPNDNLIKLVQHLGAGKSQRDFATELGINFTTITKWFSGKSGVGAAGQVAILQLCDRVLQGERTLKDLEDYANGKYTLEEFLDPQFGLLAKLDSFTADTVSVWLRYRATLAEKIRLGREVDQAIGAIALNKATQDLHRRMAATGMTPAEIADCSGLPLERVEEFWRGDELPSENEVIAIAPVLGAPVEDLQQCYLTGEIHSGT